MRHRPLLQNRPWVLTEDGRQNRIGTQIECSACLELEMPDQLVRTSIVGPLLSLDPADGIPPTWQVPALSWGVIELLDGVLEVLLETAKGARIRLTARERVAIPPECTANLVPGPETAIMLELWSKQS